MTVYQRLHDPVRMCTKCGEDKSFECFRMMTNRFGRPQRRTVCRQCERLISLEKPIIVSTETSQKIADYKEGRKRDSRTERERKHYCAHFRRKYGITFDDYTEMLADQGGRCAICRRQHANTHKSRLNVDHCHSTGMIRGLLCDGCNNGLGHFRDDIDSLLAAVSYLSKTTFLQEEF